MAKPRVGGRNYGANADRTPPDNVGWVTVDSGKVTVMRKENPKESGEDLILGTGTIGRPGGSMLNLTRMTEAELDAVKELINTAIELARPVVRQRDEEADAAFDAGDDSFDRVYRAVPRVVLREGAVAEYRESLPKRPDHLPQAERSGVDSARED